MPELVIAVDIGGTNTRAALVTPGGEIVSRTSVATQPRLGIERGLSRMADAIRQVVGATPHESICGIGVAVPGLVDAQRGVAYSPANLPGWDDVPLKQYLEAAFMLPTHVGNDANLAALGEHRFGAGRGSADMIYMTISTGIGGGIISDGRLIVGAQGFAGEVGHTTIEPNGPECPCGNIGCLEVLASGSAMAKQAQAAVAAGEDSILLTLAAGRADKITSQTIAEAERRGDALAARIIEQAGVYIGVSLVNLIHLLNPELIVLGGGVSAIGEPLFRPIRRTVEQRAIAPARRTLRIVPAAFGDDAGLMGAAAHAFELSGSQGADRSAPKENNRG